MTRRRRGIRPSHTKAAAAFVSAAVLVHLDSIGSYTADGLSSHPTSTTARARRRPTVATLIHSENPPLVVFNDLLSSDEVRSARHLVFRHCAPGTETVDYQEDLFRLGAELEEDNHFRSSVRSSGVDWGSIPERHRRDPLETFLWVATNCPGALSEESIVVGANFIKRREARNKWKSDGGQQLLDLSMDNSPFERAGRRYQMPDDLKEDLVERLTRILRTDRGSSDCVQVGGVEWTVVDSTIVRYGVGEGQVPHVDPCDATLLVYLGGAGAPDNGGVGGYEGGDTCFPFLGVRVPPVPGNALLFFSSSISPAAGQEQRERDTASLHHGGQVHRGSKIIAQVMLNAVSIPPAADSWLDLVLPELFLNPGDHQLS